MSRFLLLILIAAPALADVESGHSGTIRIRSMPELSDIALAGMAAGAIWLVRRALRRRFRGDG